MLPLASVLRAQHPAAPTRSTQSRSWGRWLRSSRARVPLSTSTHPIWLSGGASSATGVSGCSSQGRSVADQLNDQSTARPLVHVAHEILVRHRDLAVRAARPRPSPCTTNNGGCWL